MLGSQLVLSSGRCTLAFFLFRPVSWLAMPQASQAAVGEADGQAPRRREAGKRIVLPATFGGSPRDLHQCYLDAMALLAHFGRPDYFITMIANPNLEEVKANLETGETPQDRPDLIARVFRAKLRDLIRDLTINGVLGKAVAFTYVVEFQKRGLPDAHLLLILCAEVKLQDFYIGTASF